MFTLSHVSQHLCMLDKCFPCDLYPQHATCTFQFLDHILLSILKLICDRHHTHTHTLLYQVHFHYLNDIKYHPIEI